MQYLSKRRGVISVFLLIIFMVTYVFMGLIVDAGRYKMAEAYTEAALDTASNSILASYNSLLFDLYGLFSVDLGATDEADMEKKIEELYNRYLDETLGLAKTDVSEYRTALSDAFDQIFLNYEDDAVETSKLYDFQITELNVGSTVTLADSANVESQIIEYMKFRAPVQLVDDMDGFLKKIQAILSIEKRVQDSLTKVGIMEKYQDLPEEAQKLLEDISSLVAKVYNYTIQSDVDYDSISTEWPEDVYKNSPYWIKEKIVKDFDKKLDVADDQYKEAMWGEQDLQAIDLTFLTTLYNYIIQEKQQGNWEKWELKLETRYSVPGPNSKEKTQNFSEISLDVSPSDKLKIAEEVNNAINKKKEGKDYRKEYGEGNDYDVFQANYINYQNEIDKKRIWQDRVDAYNTARSELAGSLNAMEENARELYKEMVDLGQRLTKIAQRYQDYIKELTAELEKEPNDEDKKTVYMPDIELAEANQAEVLKNIDIIMNSRQYLYELGYGSKGDGGNSDRLSKWMPDLADTIIDNRLAGESKEFKDNNLLDAIEKYVEDDKYTDAKYSKPPLYQNIYVQATGELLPIMQGDLCSVYSLTSYYKEAYYRRDVDVTNDTLEKVKKNGEDLGTDQYQSEKEEKESEKIKLDNEDMLKATDYPDYLTVNYSHSVAESSVETEFSLSKTDNVDVGTMRKLLETGLNLIKKLGDLLEGARDNLYVDAYVMSMFPNYYDYNQLVAGNEDKLTTSAFMKEYRKYTASFAEVEYIITGAGAGKGMVFSGKIQAPEDGKMAKGFGQLSVSAMRKKLFGTRLLFNSVAMFTDSAKYSQASVLSSWAGPFAPLVTVVLMVAWAVAETVLDVVVLMGDENADKYAPDGEVAIFKQGEDWFFSLEGAAHMLTDMAVGTLTNKILEQANEITDSLEKELNIMIARAYNSANDTVDGILDEIGQSSRINDWSSELIENIEKAEKNVKDKTGLQGAKTMAQNLVYNDLNKEFTKGIDGIKDKLNSVTDSAKESAVIAVSRAKDMVMEKAESIVDKAGDQVKNFVKNNIDKIVPIGKVVNTGSGGVKMSYKDYLYFYLFTMDHGLKIKRIQSVIQANMRVGGQKGFLMETAPASVWADLEVSMKYMFLSNLLVPEGLRKNGRLRLKVISSQSY